MAHAFVSPDSGPAQRVTSEQGIGPAASGRAQRLFEQASTLIRAGHYSPAVPLLRHAAVLAPDNASIHHYLGYALWKLNRWQDAEEEFEKAHRLDPGNAYTCYFLGHIAQWQGHLNRAIAFYREVLKLGPPIYDTNQLLGQAYLDKGELPEAWQSIEAALRQTPWDGSLYYQLGRIDQRRHRTQQAREEFAAATRLKHANQNSIQELLHLYEAVQNRRADRIRQLRAELLNQSAQDPELLDSLGVLLGRGGFYAEALAPLQRAVEVDPDSFEGNYNLGLTLFHLGKYSEAETALKRALEKQPQSPQVNILLGILYVDQNRNLDAIERLRAAEQATPENPRILALLGQQYLAGHYVRNAVNCLAKAIQLDPKELGVRYLLIEAYQQENDFSSALKTAQQAAALFPTDARSVYEIGQQWANLGDYRQARLYAGKALQMDPSLVAAYNLMGDIETKSGEYAAALETFQKARALDSSDIIALRGIADNLIRLKRFDQALAELKQAISLQPRDSNLYFNLMRAYARLGQQKEAARAEAAFQKLHAQEVAERNAQAPREFPLSAANSSSQ